MKNILIFSAVLIIACSTSSAKHTFEKGTGDLKTETREIKVFKELNVSHAFKIILTQGENYSLKLEGNEEMLKLVDVQQDGKELSISMKEHDGNNDNYDKQITAYITFQELNQIHLSGATTLETTNNIKTGNFTIVSSGASQVQMDMNAVELDATFSGASQAVFKGKCNKASLEVNGASDLKAKDFEIDDATLQCSGASRAFVNVRKSLDVRASGASNVKYTGAASIKQDVSGASNVNSASRP